MPRASRIGGRRQRLEASLEQLLRRATQANDLDTANKIKAEMTDGAADLQAATQFAGGPRAIEKALPGQWNWEGANLKTWGTFLENGEFMMGGAKHEWKVSSNGTVIVTRADKAKATVRPVPISKRLPVRTLMGSLSPAADINKT
jgi:hypothetical protein